MALQIKFHRTVAFVVLIAAGVWVGTGKFSSVGSDAARASQGASTPAEGDPAATDAASEPSLRTVAAVTPTFRDHAREIRLSGVTAPDKHVTLAARTNGVVESISIQKGEKVAADATVMMLEGPEIMAALSISELTFEQLTRDLGVAEKLFTRSSVTESQVTNARTAAATADAQVKQARAAVDLLTLKAPFAGLVDTVSVERGEWVQAGTPIATVLSLDPIVVQAEVSEIDIGLVTTGAKALVQLVTGAEMEGKVRFVAKEASSDTRTYRIEVALPNPDLSIPSGMTADVRLYAAPVRTVTVPRSVITLSQTGEIGVRVVGADDTAHFAAVDLVDDTPGGLILAGIPDNARIIVSGQDLVRDGEVVIVVDPEAETTPEPVP